MLRRGAEPDEPQLPPPGVHIRRPRRADALREPDRARPAGPDQSGAIVDRTQWPLRPTGRVSQRPGFIRTPDAHTIAWADFRGNRQYISIGNLSHDDRVALIFLDYPRQLRLKVYGRAQIADLNRADGAGRPGSTPAPLAVEGYRAKVEREVRIEVAAYDWNCPQHITPRYSAEELAPALQPLHDRISSLQSENARLRQALEGDGR
jgi:predicted pyridoxine 5'-phosphate oxidase superfamily flavin-nucleotide-binding protein